MICNDFALGGDGLPDQRGQVPLRLSDYGVTTEEAVHAAADELIKTFNHIALSKHSIRIGYSR